MKFSTYFRKNTFGRSVHIKQILGNLMLSADMRTMSCLECIRMIWIPPFGPIFGLLVIQFRKTHTLIAF